MVEARGVLIATVLAALVLIALLVVAAFTFSPRSLQNEACEAGQLPASRCD